MKIKILNQPGELHTCAPFFINCLLWNTTSIPRTYGRIGFVREDGFYLQMVCEEANPRRTYKEPNSPVYIDSAMEAFFQFAVEGVLSDKYLNFEMNANGALLAMYGTSRSSRAAFSEEQLSACCCQAHITDTQWSVSLRLPLSILEEIYGGISLDDGSRLACNFYKLSEDSDIEHFASYAPIISEVPNFHLPEFFEPCILTASEDL